jgi:hypothetical protein
VLAPPAERSGVRLAAGAKHLSVPPNVRMGYGTRPASCSTGAGLFVRG